MDCFIDHIAIHACLATGQDAAELFITSLPGITFKMIESLVDEDKKSLMELWGNIQKNAMLRFKKDFLRKFNTKYTGFCCSDEGCDPETICCDNIEFFEEAWMYILGIQLMIERMYSTTWSRFTTIDKQQASELKDFYQVEYEKSLNAALCMIPKDTISACFESKSSSGYTEVLP